MYIRGMRRLLLLLIILPVTLSAQEDTIRPRRMWLVGGVNAGLWGGSTVMLNEIWYKDFPKSHFHAFNDAGNWMNMDKCGHTYTAYQLAVSEYGAWRWAGMKPKAATWLSGGIALGYLSTVEVLDGFSAEWGFSWADIAANSTGSVLFVSQQLIWGEQRFRLKFSYKPSYYAALRPEILGSTFSERLLKDYNAQSYWLTFSPGAFTEKRFPDWLQLAVGYSTDAQLKGDSRTYTINDFTYEAKPEWGISLDVDWNRLPIQKPWLKKLVKPLNAVKIPFPAVYWRNGVCYFGLM